VRASLTPLNSTHQDFMSSADIVLTLALIFSTCMTMALAVGIPSLVMGKLRLRLALALDASSLSVWEIDLTTDIVHFDRHWSRTMGGAPGETLTTGMALIGLTHPDDVEQSVAAAVAVINGPDNIYQTTNRIKTAAGKWKWIKWSGLVVKRNSAGKALRVIGTNFDVSEERIAEQEAHQLAFFDGLTELPNRRLIVDRLTQAVSQLGRHEHLLAVICLEVDYARKIAGNASRDIHAELVKIVANRLTESVRSSDIVSHQSGDRFEIVLTEVTNVADITVVAAKLLRALSIPIEVSGQTIHMTTSMGISISSPDETNDANELLKRADIALQTVKKSGPNNYLVFGSNPI
jgi:diguanylate cyclase (GGDEF)-like protein/PAS domain S-box-containing protein